VSTVSDASALTHSFATNLALIVENISLSRSAAAVCRNLNVWQTR
jgi:hypothetical protein